MQISSSTKLCRADFDAQRSNGSSVAAKVRESESLAISEICPARNVLPEEVSIRSPDRQKAGGRSSTSNVPIIAWLVIGTAATIHAQNAIFSVRLPRDGGHIDALHFRGLPHHSRCRREFFSEHQPTMIIEPALSFLFHSLDLRCAIPAELSKAYWRLLPGIAEPFPPRTKSALK